MLNVLLEQFMSDEAYLETALDVDNGIIITALEESQCDDEECDDEGHFDDDDEDDEKDEELGVEI